MARSYILIMGQSGGCDYTIACGTKVATSGRLKETLGG